MSADPHTVAPSGGATTVAPDAAAAPGLEVVGVHKSFGTTHVLKGIDLAIPSGSLLAVLGPSGCGKTTLLRSIAGFSPIDAGVIRVDGRTLADDHTWVPPERRRVGIVPQEGALFPHLRVGENVAFGLRKAPDREARVREWLDIVGLAHLAGARPHELSGGQQQRVALARALAADPALILLDEPFASLDAALRGTVRAEIAGVLRRTGRTAVLVTHDQHEALSTADLVAVLLDGRLAQLAPPTEIYGRPASLEVARFVGEAVVVDGDVHQGTVATALGRLPVANDAAAGAAAVVLRPEQLMLDETAAPVTVISQTYTGPDTALGLVTDTGVELVARSAGLSTLRVGDRTGVRVHGPVLAYPSGG
jgi:iron(III) transport system ATP-binding protein